MQHHVLFNAPREAAGRLPNTLFYEDLIAGSDEDFTWRSTDENMAMGMCYTSGTTGEPKGALYSHRSMFLHTLGESQVNALGVSEADTVLVVVPQFHAMAWGLPYAAVAAGAELVMPGPHLKPEPLANLIAQERVTVAAGVPTIWNGLYHELKQHPRDISCVRALVVGGAAMPRSLTQAYESELGVNVLHAWGMTEMSPLGDGVAAEQRAPGARQGAAVGRQGQAGLSAAGRRTAHRGRGGRGTAVGRQDHGRAAGARAVDHPAVFQARRHHGLHDRDGWFRTGDVVTISPDGYMTITDRTKDLVKSGGEWISTVELENTIIGHPKVLEAAVIAVPDEKWSERPLAAVVRTQEGWDLTEEECWPTSGERAPKFWVPDRVIFIDEVPKTSVG